MGWTDRNCSHDNGDRLAAVASGPYRQTMGGEMVAGELVPTASVKELRKEHK